MSSRLHLLTAVLLGLLRTTFAAEPTSKNDPFHAIAAHAPRTPEQPICCLNPLSPPGAVEDQVFMSFEEWKAKQSALHPSTSAAGKGGSNYSDMGVTSDSTLGNGSADSIVVAPGSEDGSAKDSLNWEESKAQPGSPHFRVPITDRFNYASMDCSARVHGSHKSAKSKSAILSSKRDRYMLSPCKPLNGEQHFVVVELCDDIRIDTVQLANFEFFSGVFKDFKVSVAKTYSIKPEEWTDAGTYRAKNIRGVQSFHQTSLRDFYRYIRIDFLSYYGNEFYCPISLLRVYGLTHLEQWKWDTWEAESKARYEEALKKSGSIVAPAARTEHASETHIDPSSSSTKAGDISPRIPTATPSPTQDPKGPARVDSIIQLQTISMPVPSSASSATTSVSNNAEDKPAVPPASSSPFPNSVSQLLTQNASKTVSSNDHATTSLMSTAISTFAPQSAVHADETTQQSSKATHTKIHIPSAVDSLDSQQSISFTKSSTSTSITTSSVISSSPTSLPVTGGESIYRTIMNRLTALEANHTLYARYVEQQITGVREVLRRLSEDVGRLEGISRAQSAMYQRSLSDWEKRQKQLQSDVGELASRVDHLSDEIILEKRLGIAQLCLLLAVLVFMALTRGSRGEALIEHSRFNKSVRDWGRRHLSLSNDWTHRFMSKSRSQSVTPRTIRRVVRPSSLDLSQDDNKIAFPSKVVMRTAPLEARNLNIDSPREPSSPRNNTRSRTPSLRTGGMRPHLRPVTPTSSALRPRLQRSNSQGGHLVASPHGASNSALPRRRWAKISHLHEVRTPDPFSVKTSRKDNSDRENVREDARYQPADGCRTNGVGTPRHRSSRTDHDRGRKSPITDSDTVSDDGDGWVDTDYDD